MAFCRPGRRLVVAAETAAWTTALRRALRPLDAPPEQDPVNRDELADLIPAGEALRPAAVLVPLVPRPQGWQVLLTRRAPALSQHGGQISFPGGRIEATDANPVAAALRETHEELGIHPAAVTPLGLLDVQATISSYAVTPVVGVVDPNQVWRPDPREVDLVFELPLSFVLDRSNLRREQAQLRGRLRAYYLYAYGEHAIWGATAGILVNLLERLDRHGLGTVDRER
jgi:8-oxo-dGTP pyrophosphatase MutT (NUDIX family)